MIPARPAAPRKEKEKVVAAVESESEGEAESEAEEEEEEEEENKLNSAECVLPQLLQSVLCQTPLETSQRATA